MLDKQTGSCRRRTGKPNAPVALGETTIELVVQGTAIQASATPVLRLLPDPSLVIDFEGPYSGLAGIEQIGPSVKLLPQGVKLDVNATSLSFGDGNVRGRLVPRRQPSTVLPTRKRLKSVQFSVLNFPEFFGGQDQVLKDHKGGVRRLGGAQLNAGHWRIEIIAVPNLKALTQELKKDGGYAITHTGTARRSDGTFTVKDAERLLEGLRLFLSFARGAFCSLTLHTGLNRDGEKSWEQWGAHTVAPWGYTPSWFDTMNGQILSEVFPGFWDRLNDPTWDETIRTALYWYLRSNGHGRGAGVDGGLILTQAALERLSYVQLGYSPGRAADLIRQALGTMRIKTNIPRSCRKMRALARSNGWRDGPHALTAVRNDLVHPRQKHGKALPGSYFEAWNLGQRYVELMLLRLFRHKGLHANRLTQKWRGQVVRVPWA